MREQCFVLLAVLAVASAQLFQAPFKFSKPSASLTFPAAPAARRVVSAPTVLRVASYSSSGSYSGGGDDGQYHPDDSGSYSPDGAGGYVHQDAGYNHQDAGYRHQDEGYRHQGGGAGGGGGGGSGGAYQGGGGSGGSGAYQSGSGATQFGSGVSQFGSGKYNSASSGSVFGSATRGASAGSGAYQSGSSGASQFGSGVSQFGSGKYNQGGSSRGSVSGSGNRGAFGGNSFSGISASGSLGGNAGASGLKQGSAAGLYDNRNYGIIRKVEQVEQDGYHYVYETENGITGEEQGHLEQKGSKDEAMHAKGYFTYTGPDSIVYTVEYTADENGFLPVGAHLPTPPPVPEAIVRALEYQRSLGLLKE